MFMCTLRPARKNIAPYISLLLYLGEKLHIVPFRRICGIALILYQEMFLSTVCHIKDRIQLHVAIKTMQFIFTDSYMAQLC